MPVPVSVTHPQGKGVAGAKQNALETEGPFARLARLKAEAEQQQQQQAAVTATQQQASVAQAESAANGDLQYSIVVSHLDFAYPGLGECDVEAAAVG